MVKAKVKTHFKRVASLLIAALLVSSILLVYFSPWSTSTSDHEIVDYPLFKDGYYANLANGSMGEMTAIAGESGIDMWAWGHYFHTVNGHDFDKNEWMPDSPNDWARDFVLLVDGVYYRYCSNLSDNGAFYLATGTDKVNWTTVGLVLDRSVSGWDSHSLGNLCVWVEEGTWYMLYEADGKTTWQIGLATSHDGVNWEKYSGNPVIPAFNAEGCGHPCIARNGSSVLKVDGKYYVWFHSQNAPSPIVFNGVYRAYSYDLHTWVVEGIQEGIVKDPNPGNCTNWGDVEICGYGGHTYLYYSPTNQVSGAHENVVIDNRSLEELLRMSPTGVVG